MARSTSNHCACLLLLLAAAAAALLTPGGDASGLGFNLHHRFSPVVRRWAEARGHPAARWPQPREGSPEYYAALSRHDRALFARRSLAEGGLLTFADGNETFRLDGSLHYAEVALGTPNTTFLVALDTGSDLFWVPCDCKQCANLTDPGDPPLRPYSPRQSSTSKPVGCGHALCERRNACAAAGNSSCPYTVRYASANTSSSGFLVEDVLYLTRETPGGAAVKAPIVFGCGQEQTGMFLDGGAPDGLMGLGMGAVSVPSALAGSGSGLVASNSFSMCFGRDGVGRINFGDAGSPGQAETPFIVTDVHPMYNISVTAITVEDKSLPVQFAAVVDSGTSFTYLRDPAYTQLATNFNSQIREKRANYGGGGGNSSVPFDYCYELSPNQSEVVIPDVSLTTMGGALFPVLRPVVGIVADVNASGQARVVGYCLAVIKSDISIDIIGQNFMTGLKVVFDRQRAVLGWEKFDCYKNVRMADAPGPAPFKPKATDVTNGHPGAAPVPRPTGGSGHAGRCVLGGLYLLLLPLLLHAQI